MKKIDKRELRNSKWEEQTLLLNWNNNFEAKERRAEEAVRIGKIESTIGQKQSQQTTI